MSRRSIAEIIGWEFHYLGRIVCCDSQGRPTDSRAAGNWTRPGAHHNDKSRPTVDDMLDWLRRERRFVALALVGDNEVVVEYVHPDGFNGHVKGLTIHAALEAVIRAIDKAEDDQ